MQHAGAYQRGEFFYIEAYATTTTGLWIANGLLAKVISTDIEQVGKEIVAALAASRVGIPHPTQEDWKNRLAPLLTLAGVGSWQAFMRGAKSVGIDLEDGIVTFRPERNSRKQGGFVPIEGGEIQLAADRSLCEFGETLLMAMSRSR